MASYSNAMAYRAVVILVLLAGHKVLHVSDRGHTYMSARGVWSRQMKEGMTLTLL